MKVMSDSMEDWTKSLDATGVKIDLNKDGIPDYFVAPDYPSSCGTGGCAYALFDGAHNSLIGEFSGDPIWLMKQKINGMPVVQSFSHQSSDSGFFKCYVFDGNRYIEVSSIMLHGKDRDPLFK
jgi:hypothetical protein